MSRLSTKRGIKNVKNTSTTKLYVPLERPFFFFLFEEISESSWRSVEKSRLSSTNEKHNVKNRIVRQSPRRSCK